MYVIEPAPIMIPVGEIKVGRSIKNIRTQFDAGEIADLADSIYEGGLLNPLVVMETADPETGDEIIELVCGSRRLRAIQSILENRDVDWNDGEVRCNKFVGSLEDAKLLNGVENIDRQDVDPVDELLWVHRMVEEEGHDPEGLAKRLHRGAQWVSLRLTICRKGSEELLKALREGIISISAAYELAKNLSKEDQDKRIKQARTAGEKLIKLEDAKVEGKPDKTAKPSKKTLMSLLALAEEASTNPKKRNAHGVAMGLRGVLGLCAEDEVKAAIQYEPEEEAGSTPVERVVRRRRSTRDAE
jgi:ParB/RepB/Spo0J family partition protein